MPNEPQRNLLAEAVAIASGTSRLMAERAHLMAMAGELEKTIKLAEALSEAIGALMLFAQTTELAIRAEKIMEVRARKSVIVVEKQPDGSVRVRSRQTKPPMVDAPTDGKVM